MANKKSVQPASQSGRNFVITGTSGLAYEAAKALLSVDGNVVLAGRNIAKGQMAVTELSERFPQNQVKFEQLDLASLQSIADFSGRLTDQAWQIDCLINNAGIMSPPKREVTKDDHEMQFGVNYLGHFALTLRLLPLMAGRDGARVVSITSLAQHLAKLDLGNLECLNGYNPGQSYSVSKLLQAIFAAELQRRLDSAGSNIASLAAHPGVASTGLFATSGRFSNFFGPNVLVPLVGQSAAQGVLPMLYAATSPQARGGKLYGPAGFLEMKGPPKEGKYAGVVRNTEIATALWALSERLTGLSLGQALR